MEVEATKVFLTYQHIEREPTLNNESLLANFNLFLPPIHSYTIGATPYLGKAIALGKFAYKHRKGIEKAHRLGKQFAKSLNKKRKREHGPVIEAAEKQIERSNKMAKRSAKKSRGSSNRPPAGGYRNPRFVAAKKAPKRKKGKKKLVLVTKKQVKKWNKGAKDAATDLATYNNYQRVVFSTQCLANGSEFEFYTAMNISRIYNLSPFQLEFFAFY